MNQNTIIISFFVLSFPMGISFAAPMSYETYQQESRSYCEDGKPWYSEATRNSQKVTYPKLDTDSINTWISIQRAQAENESPTMRDAILQQLDPVRLGAIESSKVLEIAQVAYHARMNTTFDCAVIESRKNIIELLKKTTLWQSEILEKIKKEEIALDQKSKQCIPKDSSNKNQQSSIETTRNRLINTTILQYCHYRKYLTYIESNMTENITAFNTIDWQIWESTNKQRIQDSESLQRILLRQKETIRNEIYRADRAIPRAIAAFKEMERTYAAHLLLVIIYDDYVKLRDNLARYMSSTSQLFEKAYNAMSP